MHPDLAAGYQPAPGPAISSDLAGVPPDPSEVSADRTPLTSLGRIVTAHNIQFCCRSPQSALNQKFAQIGGYLEPSLSMPRLTRTSAALTCS
jgi:hypothetical protein